MFSQALNNILYAWTLFSQLLLFNYFLNTEYPESFWFNMYSDWSLDAWVSTGSQVKTDAITKRRFSSDIWHQLTSLVHRAINRPEVDRLDFWKHNQQILSTFWLEGYYLHADCHNLQTLHLYPSWLRARGAQEESNVLLETSVLPDAYPLPNFLSQMGFQGSNCWNHRSPSKGSAECTLEK